MRDHDVVANFDGEQGGSLRIGDGLAECPGASGVENFRQKLRQIAKRNRRGQQCVEPGIASSATAAERRRLWRPARTMRRGDASDLARYQPKPAAVERRRQEARSRAASPYQLISSTVASSPASSSAVPVHRASRWHERPDRNRASLLPAQRNQHQVQRLIPRGRD